MKLSDESLREEIQEEEAAKSQDLNNEQSEDVQMEDAEEEKGKVATREELLSMLGYEEFLFGIMQLLTNKQFGKPICHVRIGIYIPPDLERYAGSR